MDDWLFAVAVNREYVVNSRDSQCIYALTKRVLLLFRRKNLVKMMKKCYPLFLNVKFLTLGT